MTVVAASHCLQQDHQRRRNATGEPVQGIRRKIIQKNLKKLEPEKGYTCYLCRQKGHLMRSCPLLNQAKSSLETHNPQQLAQYSAQSDTSIHQLPGQPQPQLSLGRIPMPQNCGHRFAGQVVEEKDAVVDGKILYFNLEAKILIDTSALHSFIFARFPILLSLRPEILEL